jgi:hypothetical protein
MFPPFSTNGCDLFLHIMMVLGFYHSMMLRGDQSLYEVITIAQRLLLADKDVCGSIDVKGLFFIS